MTKITNNIHFNNIRGDIFGGLTAAVIALPMALAFGVASGAGPSAGLWGAILVGFFAALFGGTPTLISEPTGPMTVIMAAVITNLSTEENGMAMAFTVVMLAGIFQIIFGVLRLGKYITLMPYTVISGFMSGIGVILVILQIPPFLGQETEGGVIGTVTRFSELLRKINPPATILAAMTVAIIFLMPHLMPPKWKRNLPPQLVALILGTIISLIFFSTADLRVIGEIPVGLPQLVIPTFSADQLQLMFINGLILGMLGSIDALLTSLVADSLTRTEHNSDKELIGQGLGNIFAGLFGGIAGAGATMGTVVNIQTGARTALSGLTRALLLLIIVLGAAPLLSSIPHAVLAGIALKVGIDIIDWGFLKRAHHISWKAALIMYGVIVLTVFVDLIVAVGVGVFVANILTIERLSNLRAQSVKTVTDADDEIQLSNEERHLLDKADGRVLLFHLSGPMIFGVAKAISRQHYASESCDVLILDLSDVPILGVTSSLAIENVIQETLEDNSQIIIVGATGKVKHRLQKLNIMEKIPPQHLLRDRLEALKLAVNYVSGQQQTTDVAGENSSTYQDMNLGMSES